MIRNALGEYATAAGGYVTLRDVRENQLLGFDLAPASALADPESLLRAQRFLDFKGGPKSNHQVFAQLGADLLHEALESTYAVADEFGGIELLIPSFMESLQILLRSDVPCIGVFKTRQASGELADRIKLGEDYRQAYAALESWLQQDPDTEILPTTGRYDDQVRDYVNQWVLNYVRK